VLTSLKNLIKSNPVLRRTVYGPLRFAMAHTVRRAATLEEKRMWEQRNRDVIGCSDNDHIPRVPDAGRVVAGTQTMHNGIRIRTGSYYGSSVTRMLELNKGVHEPQEERVFQEVLKHVRPDGVMMELGAYWGFYSMWFLTGSPRRRAILVEPEAANLEQGQGNFKLAGLTGEFVRAFAGAAPAMEHGMRTICVDELMEQYKIDRLDILHSDIQGFEGQMLEGARKSLARKAIDYVFVSTHGDELHETCKRVLREAGFEIIADANMRDTYSHDGLVVARRADLPGLGPVKIALKSVDGVRGA
jgi:hypothetical protein